MPAVMFPECGKSWISVNLTIGIDHFCSPGYEEPDASDSGHWQWGADHVTVNHVSPGLSKDDLLLR